jgi:hypothetical protein
MRQRGITMVLTKDMKTELKQAAEEHPSWTHAVVYKELISLWGWDYEGFNGFCAALDFREKSGYKPEDSVIVNLLKL